MGVRRVVAFYVLKRRLSAGPCPGPFLPSALAHNTPQMRFDHPKHCALAPIISFYGKSNRQAINLDSPIARPEQSARAVSAAPDCSSTPPAIFVRFCVAALLAQISLVSRAQGLAPDASRHLDINSTVRSVFGGGDGGVIVPVVCSRPNMNTMVLPRAVRKHLAMGLFISSSCDSQRAIVIRHLISPRNFETSL